MRTSLRLSIAMIAEEFKGSIVESCFHQYDKMLLIERYRFYDGDLKLHSDTIYILKRSSLPSLELLSIEEGTSMIFLGDKEGSDCPENIAYFCISPEDVPLGVLINKLSAVFEKYRRFDHALKETVFSDDSMQKLVEIATALFGNEITIRDSGYHHIAHSYKTLRYADDPLDKAGYTAVDEIQDLKTDPDYKESLCTENVWSYQYKDHKMICFDIFVHDIFIYRVKLIDIDQDFRPYDPALFLYFVDIVKEKYLHMKDNSSDDAPRLQKIFHALLEPDTPVKEQDMQFFLKNLGLDASDRYLIISMRSGKNTGSITAYPYYNMLMDQSFDLAYSIAYEDRLAVLIKMGPEWQQKDPVPKKLLGFLRDENFRAGISFPFSDLFKASIYHQQAQIALQLGMAYAPFTWVYFFKDYRYQYLYDIVSERFPGGRYMVPELHDLLEWDRKNNTEYLKTLRLYIDNDRNVTQTAKGLSVHRSTLLYRLDKISSITHTNIEDTDTLNLFFLFLKFAGYDPGFL